MPIGVTPRICSQISAMVVSTSVLGATNWLLKFGRACSVPAAGSCDAAGCATHGFEPDPLVDACLQIAGRDHDLPGCAFQDPEQALHALRGIEEIGPLRSALAEHLLLPRKLPGVPVHADPGHAARLVLRAANASRKMLAAE